MGWCVIPVLIEIHKIIQFQKCYGEERYGMGKQDKFVYSNIHH